MHRFVWIFPKPVYGNFDSLEEVNEDFDQQMGNLHTGTVVSVVMLV